MASYFNKETKIQRRKWEAVKFRYIDQINFTSAQNTPTEHFTLWCRVWGLFPHMTFNFVCSQPLLFSRWLWPEAKPNISLCWHFLLIKAYIITSSYKSRHCWMPLWVWKAAYFSVVDIFIRHFGSAKCQSAHVGRERGRGRDCCNIYLRIPFNYW